jgi:hypothetical protein
MIIAGTRSQVFKDKREHRAKDFKNSWEHDYEQDETTNEDDEGSPMSKPELQRRLAYAEGQFAVAQQYSAYWCAQATTGLCKLRKIRRGVAEGGWRDATKQQSNPNR